MKRSRSPVARLLPWAVAALLTSGCGVRAPAPLTDSPELDLPHDTGNGETLQVRLVFGAEADLDLYVTDPRQETVYFGNTPSRAGGILNRDLRCDAPAPRVEVVTFALVEPGRYRVGVDFSAPCRWLRGPVPFRIEVLGGGSSQSHEGEIRSGRFEHIVLEFEVEP